ncbi:MAG: helix-turn-helix domain-containing protein [Pseudomonadota bacterium]
MSDPSAHVSGYASPGPVLKAAREGRGLSEREAADQLNLMPDYVGILERDDYQALRSPAFARGYVRAYARLLELDERRVLELFDESHSKGGGAVAKRVETRPLQLQSTGLGIVVGLGALLLLVVVLWWLRGEEKPAAALTQPLSNGEHLASP